MFGRELGFIDPFDNDDAGDKVDFKQAMSNVDKEISSLNFDESENDMSEDKKPVKKVVKEAAAPVKKTVAKKVEPAKKPEATKKAEPAKKPEAAKKAPAKAAGPRGLAVPEGFVGLEAICKELKTNAVLARRKLRNAKDIEKPSVGVWAWKDGSKELAKVKALLTPKAKA